MIGWPDHLSRDPSAHVRPGQNTTLMLPVALAEATRTEKPRKLLVAVCSAVAHSKERDAIR